MLDKLFARDTKFYDLFDRAAERVAAGAKLMEEMLSHADNREDYAKRIKDIEHEADKITHETIRKIHQTFVTPLDRDDIHRFIKRVDNILDIATSAAQRMILYELREAPPDAIRLAKVLTQAATEVGNAIKGLRNLKSTETTLQACDRINSLESEGDELLRTGIARLFREEEDIRALLMWKEVYETLEAAIDRCDDVANIIEGVVLEHA